MTNSWIPNGGGDPAKNPKPDLSVPLLPASKDQSNVAIKAPEGVILAIEDETEDVELLRLALAQGNFPCKLVSVPFARDAIKYLTKIGEYSDESHFPRPTLIILDLSLPGMSGREFLTWAWHEPNVPPIVVLTYSQLKEDRLLAEKLGAKAFFVKSLDLNAAETMVETLRTLALPGSIPTGQTGAPSNQQSI